MSFFNKLKRISKKIFGTNKQKLMLEEADFNLTKRMDRLERNYIILLKRMLEIDGVQLKSKAFTSKVLRTPSDELSKGLNEPEPTIH